MGIASSHQVDIATGTAESEMQNLDMCNGLRMVTRSISNPLPVSLTLQPVA